MNRDILRIVPLFADLDTGDLDKLCEMVDELRLADGELLFAEGDVGDKAYVIKSGELEIVKKHSSGRDVLLAVRKRGEVIGEMSLLEDAPRMASVRAKGDTRLLAIDRDVINDLVGTSASAARAMFHTILARSRATGTMLRESEKMAQLGTLTAGVAHELNNPAAAVRRSARRMEDGLLEYGRARAEVEPLRDDAGTWAIVESLEHQIRSAAARHDELDALERSDREADVEDWLYDEGVDDAFDVAPALVSLRLAPDDLEELRNQLGDCFEEVLRWASSSFEVFSLLAEIGEGASRISQIVKSLKSYAYLDQGETQEVDVHEGLEDTLVLLRSKMKHLDVTREYGEQLPRVPAYGSELNQVWTNVLDNAAYAVGDQGHITIRTREERGFVVVEIEDDGPGIPDDVRQRIFDPFYTTKPPGEGTGLGLDISYRIVANRHSGEMKVRSSPGQTVFEVWLPTGEAKAMAAIDQPSDEVLGVILDDATTIAVVGISSDESRPAHSVPRYLRDAGYTIVGVHPRLDDVFGEPTLAELPKIEQSPDIVLAFRRSEHMPDLVNQAIEVGAETFWMPEGVVNEVAAETARAAGMRVVMDLCIRATHQRLRG